MTDLGLDRSYHTAPSGQDEAAQRGLAEGPETPRRDAGCGRVLTTNDWAAAGVPSLEFHAPAIFRRGNADAWARRWAKAAIIAPPRHTPFSSRRNLLNCRVKV